MPGKAVKDFALPSTGGGSFRLSDQRGKKLVLYFYPKDNTPGCTTEGADFRDLYRAVPARRQREVFGVSRDSLKSHEGFKAKMSFPFELLSDADEKRLHAVRRDQDEEHVRQEGARHRAQHLRRSTARASLRARMARRQGSRPRTGGTRTLLKPS